MEFNELIKARYSCKKYGDKKIPREVLTRILEAGRLAPTAKNLQEQKIYAAESEEALKKIDKCTKCRYGAPTVLVVAYDRDNVYTYPGGKRQSGVEDATIAASHLMLAASNEGVDNCWINNFDPDILKKELNLPENEEILMMLDLGYAEEGVKPLPNHYSRKPLSETVIYI